MPLCSQPDGQHLRTAERISSRPRNSLVKLRHEQIPERSTRHGPVVELAAYRQSLQKGLLCTDKVILAEVPGPNRSTALLD